MSSSHILLLVSVLIILVGICAAHESSSSTCDSDASTEGCSASMEAAAAPIARRVFRVGRAHSQKEGAGFVVKRPFPSHQITDQQSDPFLMLDEFGPKIKEKNAPGAPWHPHRGFDTVTYMKAGESAHQDSMGNSGVVRAGEVQWMRAAAGVVHDEGRDHPGGLIHGFQMWVNLPASMKMSEPMYQQLSAETFEWQPYEAHGSTNTKVKIIAGELPGLAPSPFEVAMPIMYVDVNMGPDSELQLSVPGLMETAIVYVYDGEGKVLDGGNDKAGTGIATQDFVLFKDPSEEEQGGMTNLKFKSNAAESGLKFVLMAGKKLREPIARYGPFVMNTQQEIRQAMEDYQSGKLAQVKGKSNVF